MSDGEEGNTSDHSNSPDESADRREDRLAEKLDDLLSQTPEAPIEISSHSDGLSDKECAVRRVKTQMSLGRLCAAEERGYEVGTSPSSLHYALPGPLALEHYASSLSIAVIDKHGDQKPT